MPDTEPVERMTLRLSPDLYEALKQWAEREERSLHGQVAYLLRRAVAEHEAQENMTPEDAAERAALIASAERITRALAQQTGLGRPRTPRQEES